MSKSFLDVLLATALLTTAQVVPVFAESESSTQITSAAALEFLKNYEKQDKTGNAKLIDMYADDASIESDIERKDSPTFTQKYSKAAFANLINKSFANPLQAKLIAETKYSDAAYEDGHLKFQATSGDSAMRIDWLLRKDADGKLKIAREHSVTFRISLGHAKVRESSNDTHMLVGVDRKEKP